MVRPGVSIGDAVRAFAELTPASEPARAEIWAQLGFEVGEDQHEPNIGPWKPSLSDEPDVGATAGDDLTNPHQSREVPRPTRSPAEPTAGGSSHFEPLEPRSLAPPSWFGEVGNMLASATVSRGQPEPPPPLFSPLQHRAIVSAALTDWRADGEIDVDRVTDALVRMRPLESVPRRPRPRLHRPVEILVDHGPSMAPYRADVRDLLARMRGLVSGDQLTIRVFRGTPVREVRERGPGNQERWRPPGPGTGVLVVSTLALVGPADDDDAAGPAEWLRFGIVAREADLNPACLVPVEARRWPPALARVLLLLHWSERTTAAAVLRAVREHRRVRV